MRSRPGFQSCLPALLATLGYSPEVNPGEMPADTLAVLGALAVTEAKLDNERQVSDGLADTINQMTWVGNVVMTAAGREIGSLRSLLADARLANNFANEDRNTLQRRLNQALADLAKANEKLAGIENVMSGVKVGEDTGENGAPAHPIH